MGLQPGDADHEEFVEVAGRDRQEAKPLQQRVVPLQASSSTRRLNASQLSSRLKIALFRDWRSGGAGSAAGGDAGAADGSEEAMRLLDRVAVAMALLLTGCVADVAELKQSDITAV